MCVRERENTHGRTVGIVSCVFLSGNFKEMLYEGRMEDEISFMYFFFFEITLKNSFTSLENTH